MVLEKGEEGWQRIKEVSKSTFIGQLRVSLISNGDSEGDNAIFFVALVKSKDRFIALFIKVHE